ncbi:MAG TPA: alkaline phosphatase family protein, partial [Anaerolineales bacterium]
YNAVRNGKDWDQTLFIITFDEHGGCYDHVSPPAATPPDPKAPIGQQGFKFDRLGVRVPTVMVSPYIEKGTVISDTHDHTSILRLVGDRWNLKPLTERDKQANTLEKVLSLEIPRVETVILKPRVYKVPRSTLDEPLNDLQRTILFMMAGFEDALRFSEDKNLFLKAQELFQVVVDEGRIARIKTVGQAIHFATAFDRRVTKHLSFLGWLRIKLKLLFRLI